MADARCPDTYPLGPSTDTRPDGPLVATGPTAAVLCTYSPGDSGGAVALSRSRNVDAAAADAVAALLNRLPNAEKAFDGQAEPVCAAVAGDQYNVVLAYRQYDPMVVRVNANCGSVAHAGAVRYLTGQNSLKALLALLGG
ncbi:hypothetical protein [Catellatospora sp. TT07R-123]|uniref:hypothetical protein n=1 Tax=Catellatospora sp. TT07R-123 TaxID=2733863 RepID=UPI001BB42389|nr:hypothetical protein [Catellatospora sp. TT07R-123]